ELSWEQFADFHRRFYHPANAWLYFCGDDDPDRRLELLAVYLDGFEPLALDSAVPEARRWNEPRRLEETYAVSEESASEEAPKSMVAVNWLLEGGLDAATLMGLQILEHILIGTPAAPLRKALIDSGLGEELTGTGMESELLQPFFSTGLKGVEVGREAAVEQLVLEELARLARDGIEAETVAAALNTTEFRLRENNTGSYPRGLVLMLRALSTWLYDGDPFEVLAFEAPLGKVKAAAGKAGYFEGLIRRHLLENGHRTTVYLKPDKGRAAREEAEEKARLEAARAGMDAQTAATVTAAARALKERQERPDTAEDLARLPRLQLADLDRQIRTIPSERSEVAGCPLLHHDLFTNGIIYADIGFDLRCVPQDLLPYLPLFGRALLEIGLDKEDFVRLSQRIGSRTGGVWTHSLIAAQRRGPAAVARFFVRGKAMAGQLGDLFDIVRDILLTVRLDNRERFLQMALEERASEEAHIVPGGHGVVSTRLRSRFDEAAWISEQVEGVSYLFFLRRLVEKVQRDWGGVVEKLEALRRVLVNRRTLLVNGTFPAADRPAFEAQLTGLVESLPEAPEREAGWQREPGSGDEGLVIPAQVNYVGRAADLYGLGYELHGSVGVITRFLRNTWLWDRVRVQGGAYGAFCSFDHFTGVLSFVSYRDPNVLPTLEVYAGSARYLRELDLSQDELTKAIISTIGELDGYQLPDAKGYTSMVRQLTGVDDDFRQRMRDAVLGTRVEDFRAFGEVLGKMGDDTPVIVLGPREALARANAARGGKMTMVPVL
ncbi:MAG: insulinase family protein, partial [Gemmatimonadota bacterium]